MSWAVHPVQREVVLFFHRLWEIGRHDFSAGVFEIYVDLVHVSTYPDDPNALADTIDNKSLP